MAIVKKKVCLIGDFGVGKTSLVSRFVNNVYSEKYLTTVGVKVDTKEVSIANQHVKLVIWDIAGVNRFTTIDTHYLNGAAGYMLVVDGTRRNTFETALNLKAKTDNLLNSPPFVVLINKSDLHDKWEVSAQDLSTISKQGWPVWQTSAKHNVNVELAFDTLTRSLLI